MGADHDRISLQDSSPGRNGSGIRGRFLRAGVGPRLCLQRQGAANVHRRRVSPICSSEIPDIPRITACIYKQRANLSSGCRAVMDRDLAQQAKVAAK